VFAHLQMVSRFSDSLSTVQLSGMY
jgi:hypothetical protein